MKLFRNKKIEVRSQNGDSGVFANDLILPGEILEENIVIHPDKKNDTVLDIAFAKKCYSWMSLHSDWNKRVDERGYLNLEEICYPVLVSGFAMIYKGSQDPNVIWEIDSANDLISFRAKRKIKSGEELFILK